MKILLLSTLCYLPLLAFGQNLVPNPGFEQTIPDNQVVHWHQPPTTNYHHKKAGDHGEPYAGEYMSGICISNMHFSECMFAVLNDSLRKGATYQLSFYTRQQPGTEDCFNFNAGEEIQVYFPRKAPPVLPKRLYAVDEQRLVRIPLTNDEEERLEWKKYEATYTAQGGEQIIAFSFFMRHDTTKPLYIPREEADGRTKYSDKAKVIDKEGDNPIMRYYGSGDQAFRVRYYFDEVKLIPENPEAHQPAEKGMPEQLEKGQQFTLDAIQFEFDKTRLLSSALPTLDSLLQLLKNQPSIKVRIIAHTDSIGSDEYNRQLSKGRAKSVANYLKKNGINMDRMQTVGKGETQPIATNATEEGRARNRRVAFVIIE